MRLGWALAQFLLEVLSCTRIDICIIDITAQVRLDPKTILIDSSLWAFYRSACPASDVNVSVASENSDAHTVTADSIWPTSAEDWVLFGRCRQYHHFPSWIVSS